MIVPRKTLHVAAWLAAGILGVPGQSAFCGQPERTTQGTPLPGNFLDIPSTAGAPFTATAVVELKRYDSEEGDQVERTLSLIARDSKGRTHNEVRRLMPQSFHGTPQVLLVRIFDPAAHTLITYDPARHTGIREFRPDPPKAFSVPNAEVKTEDLGTSTMNGLQTHGTRRTFTAAKRRNDWGKAPQKQVEEWTSEEMHQSLLVKYIDDQAGELTVGISSLKREEPPASMFETPAGYRIDDVAARGVAPEGTGADALGGKP